jgi:voltage-gated potassium channel Kch
VRVLDLRIPDWRTPGLQEALQQRLILGDMRRPHVLRQAGVEGARSVLLLSSDSGSNIEAALQAYRKGDRSHPTMRAIAQGLDDAEIAALAAYYAARGSDAAK